MHSSVHHACRSYYCFESATPIMNKQAIDERWKPSTNFGKVKVTEKKVTGEFKSLWPNFLKNIHRRLWRTPPSLAIWYRAVRQCWVLGSQVAKWPAATLRPGTAPALDSDTFRYPSQTIDAHKWLNSIKCTINTGWNIIFQYITC